MQIKPHTALAAIAALAMSCSFTPATASTAATADIRGIDVAVAAYVWPDDPYVQDLIDPAKTPIPPAFVILNIGNGEGDVGVVDGVADALRARGSQVIGYVYTSYAQRDIAKVKADVDHWLAPRNGRIHYDGIFFDETTRDCGPTAGSMAYRNYYRALREHVWSRLPGQADLVVNNPGIAIADCYLQKGRRTADVFVTFEGPAQNYLQIASAENGWTGYSGGNVFNASGYRTGTEYDSNAFWHMVYNAPQAAVTSLVELAYARHAGNVMVTDDHLSNGVLNPWDAKPSYLNQLILDAGALPY